MSFLLAASGPISAVGAGGGDSSAAAAKKKKKKYKRCSKKFIKSKKKSKRKQVKADCADKRIGKAENPKKQTYDGKKIPTANADRCDFLDTALCLLPWPNDYFTVADGSTDTGRRLNLNLQSTPANTDGVHIDPTDINRADGFSPGNKILVKLPQVQTPAAFNNTGFVPITDIASYADADQPVVVINAATGERQPIFAELDANPADPADVNLIIRPTVNFDEGARYIVALRNLRDAQDKPVATPDSFRVYRDKLITKQQPVESRRSKMEGLFSTLQAAGVPRGSLYLAWDFTVASENSLSSRVLAMRNDAYSQLDDNNLTNGVVEGDAPAFTVDTVTPNPSGNVLRRVEGTVQVPCYLQHPTDSDECAPGSSFAFDNAADRTPNIGSPTTTNVPYRCIIPDSVTNGVTVTPLKPGTYGHGLLGNRGQVNGQANLANQNDSIWCAVNWAGFADEDLGTVLTAMTDLSNFNKLADRMQQGFINFMYLGRAMMHPDGFVDNPAFQVDPADPDDAVSGGDPAIETGNNLYFEGISQGAIMGGALTAVNPDFRQSVLNVPGMNYSTLLRRSVDSDEYFHFPGAGLYFHYTDELERPLVLSLMQLLWDRGESNGYAHHMTSDPLPGTPAHNVLLQLAYGDHQVSNLTAEIEARTIGAQMHTPALDPGRHWESSPFSGLTAIGSYPYTGSAMVYYDGGPKGASGLTNTCQSGTQTGTAPAPITNVPPTDQTIYGCDPHGYPRAAVDGLAHVATFLQPSGYIDQCVDGSTPRPCYANGWTGP